MKTNITQIVPAISYRWRLFSKNRSNSRPVIGQLILTLNKHTCVWCSRSWRPWCGHDLVLTSSWLYKTDVFFGIICLLSVLNVMFKAWKRLTCDSKCSKVISIMRLHIYLCHLVIFRFGSQMYRTASCNLPESPSLTADSCCAVFKILWKHLCRTHAGAQI